MGMRPWWNVTDRRNLNYSGINPVPDLPYPLQTCYCKRTSVTVDRQLTARTVTRPSGVPMPIKYDVVYCVNLPENTALLTKSPQSLLQDLLLRGSGM